MADRARGGRGGDRGRGGGRGRGADAPRGGPARGGSFPPARGGRGGYGRGDSDRGGYGRGDSDRGGGRGGGRSAPFRGGPPRGGGGGGGFSGGRPPAQVYAPPGGPPAPDPAVRKVEDARQQARKTSAVTSALAAMTLDDNTAIMPSRPGYGTEGAPLTVYANYVELVPRSDLTLHSYDISEIKPDVAGKKRSQLVRLMIDAPELASYRNDVVSDFRSTLVSRKKLQPDEQTIEITYKAEGEDDPRPNATQYKIKVKYTKTLTVGQLMSYLISTNPAAGQQYDSKLEMIQSLNIFLKHYAKSNNNLAIIGASKTFSMNTAGTLNSSDLGRGLTAVRGFFTSVRAATNRILVNINVSHGAFYQEGQLSRLMFAYGFSNNERALRSLEKFLKRVRVRTTHLKEKKNRKGEVVHRVKTIFALAKKTDGRGLAHPPCVSQTGAGPKNVEFWLEDKLEATSAPVKSVPGAEPVPATPSKKGKGKGKGKGGAGAVPAGPQAPGAGPGKYVTVYDHFQRTYGIATDPSYPVVNVGNDKNPSYLPADVCVVVSGQSATAKLNGDQTRNMIKFAVRGPWLNAQSIVNDGFLTAGLSGSTNPLLAQFGLQMKNGLITVPARQLPEPKVFYKDDRPNSKPGSKAVNVFNGSWNMEKIKFNKPGELKTWSWVFIHDLSAPARSQPRYRYDDLVPTVAKFSAALAKNGVTVRTQPLNGREITLRYPSDPALGDLFKEASSRLDLLLIVLPGRDKTDNTEIYNTVKTLGDTKYGIHTICVVGEKFTGDRGQDQYFANVALKFNLKLGGNNQSVDPTRLSFINEDKTMLVGIDVTHPSPGSRDSAPSVAGMVASTDRQLGQWPGILSVQAVARQEMVSKIKDMLKQHLDNWLSLGRHSAYPENILVYRDGVSEGQYQAVLDQEVPLLRDACREKYPANGPQPRITVVIVGKRHHTRFYPTQEKDMDRGGNCKTGTVVDRGVTEEGMWDFYLQSHAVIQGTGRPAHYVVVLDEIFRARARGRTDKVADELEKMTQALCYCYSRATKAVSICTPAYHADILCERSRRYMADLFEGGGSDEASTTAGSVVGAGDPDVVKIHEKLKNTMFYI